jgi:hypothetical protein
LLTATSVVIGQNRQDLYGVGATVKWDNNPSRRRKIVDPEHLLRAIKNLLEHGDETSHGVTGITFKDYTIIVRKRKDLCWCIESQVQTSASGDKAG